jgi:hypothetical protein
VFIPEIIRAAFVTVHHSPNLVRVKINDMKPDSYFILYSTYLLQLLLRIRELMSLTFGPRPANMTEGFLGYLQFSVFLTNECTFIFVNKIKSAFVGLKNCRLRVFFVR